MLIVTGGDPHSTNYESMDHLARKYRLGSNNPQGVPVVFVVSRYHWEHQQNELSKQQGRSREPLSMPWIDESELNSFAGSAGLPPLSAIDASMANHDRPAELLSPIERGRIATKALSFIPERRPAALAVLTGPIDKSACALAGFSHVGQTEFFESRWDHRAIMVLAGPKLRVGLVTNHLPLREVSSYLTKELVEKKIRLFHQALVHDFEIDSPRIGVCGLNPHAGDHGLLGWEDQELIQAVIDSFRVSELDVIGPLPADTAFHAGFHGRYDGILAMYHDQGLGPLKLVHFDDAINLSGGLPHLRVSPDHGPAADLYLKGEGFSFTSWEKAFEMGQKYLKRYS